jgi:hypothetical protein
VSALPDVLFPPDVYDLKQHTADVTPQQHFEVRTSALNQGVTLGAATGVLTRAPSAPASSADGVSYRIVDNAPAPSPAPSPSPPTSADEDWLRRSSGPDVFRTVDFNTIASLGGGFGAVMGHLTQGENPAPVIDTAIKSFGQGSMRFDVLPILGGSMWWTNFAEDLSLQFGSSQGGEKFFYQFRYRVSAEVARSYGAKVFLCGTGDTPGVFESSCTDLEIELNTLGAGANAIFNMYNACPGSCGGATVFSFQEPYSWSENNYDFRLQNALDNGAALPEPQRYCLYSDRAACIKLYDHPDKWITVQVGVTLGPKRTVDGHDWFYESNVKAWVQIELGPERLMYDWTGGVTPGSTHESSPPCHGLCAGNTPGGNQRYGKLWLLPYNQELAPGAQPGKLWYDALIISKSKIPEVLA